jgi:hypothetical protein
MAVFQTGFNAYGKNACLAPVDKVQSFCLGHFKNAQGIKALRAMYTKHKFRDALRRATELEKILSLTRDRIITVCVNIPLSRTIGL